MYQRPTPAQHVQDGNELDQSTGQITPSVAISQVLLPRDQQAKSAYYDYATEKSLSHVEAKLFFQHHQLDQDQQTPTPMKRTRASSSNIDGCTGAGAISRAASTTSRRSYFDGNIGNKIHSVVPLGLASIDKPVSEADFQMPDLTGFDLYEHPFDHHLQESTTASARARDQSDYHYIHDKYSSALTSEEWPNRTDADFAKQATVGGHASKDLNVTAELNAIYANIQKILDTRHKYMRLSLQRSGDNPKDDPSWNVYPPPPEPVWDDDNNRPIGLQSTTTSLSNSKILSSDKNGLHSSSQQSVRSSSDAVPQVPSSPSRKRTKAGQDIREDFDLSDLMPLPEEVEMSFKLDDNGVYQVYENSESAKLEAPIFSIPTIRDFYVDLDSVLTLSSDGPTKSFAFRRLQYLEGKFNLYFLLNEYQEMADTKRVPHRDFYNVRKVDTHVHHTSCMNQKHLLRFIKSKMKKSPDEVVLFRDGHYLTLREVFESINLTAYDLSIDTLDMHVSRAKAENT